ncbi:MAG: class I tRNA ligase family protein, partial [Lentisphaerae bacterium]|nr:class I tRNA ligase family protein [Lentisphaerota bacterium]
PQRLRPDDQHILAGLQATIISCTENLERFRFNDAAKDLHEFVWRQFCDWYIEAAKSVFAGDDALASSQTNQIMHYVFARALQMLHPLIPFITEELWHGMGYGAAEDSIAFAAWPQKLPDLSTWGVSEATVAYVEQKHDLIRIGRTLRADYNIAPSVKVRYIIRPENKKIAALLVADRDSIAALLRVEALEIDAAFKPPRLMPNGLNKLGAIFMPLEELIDVSDATKRLSEQLEKANSDLAAVNKKLLNAAFMRKAPAEVIALQQSRQKELLEKGDKLRRLLAVLSGQES